MNTEREKLLEAADDWLAENCSPKRIKPGDPSRLVDFHLHIMDTWYVDLMKGKSVSQMNADELRTMLDSCGSVTAKYDPERGKNIVSVGPKESAKG